VLETEVGELRSRLDRGLKEDERKSTLLADSSWQTANLVLHAFAEIAWNLIPEADQDTLKQHGMRGFLDMYYARLRPGIYRGEAWRIYNAMDPNIRGYADVITSLKKNISDDRSFIAHPPVSDPQIGEFLETIAADLPLANSQADLFEYLRSTSNTPHNIENAARGG